MNKENKRDILCPFCKEEIEEPYNMCKYCGWTKNIDLNSETFLGHFIKGFKKLRFGNPPEEIREKVERIMRQVKDVNPELHTILSFLEPILTNQAEILSYSNLILRNQQRVNNALGLILDNIIKDYGKGMNKKEAEWKEFVEYVKTHSTTTMSEEDLRDYFDHMTDNKITKRKSK